MRRHPHHSLTRVEQIPFQPQRQVAAILDAPHQIRAKDAPSPAQRLHLPVGGGPHRELAKFAATGIDPDQRVGGLVRINTDNNHDSRPSFVPSNSDDRAEGTLTPPVRHLAKAALVPHTWGRHLPGKPAEAAGRR